MQQRHGSNVLAMELRLPCIKPPKLYVNSSRVWEHIRIIESDKTTSIYNVSTRVLSKK